MSALVNETLPLLQRLFQVRHSPMLSAGCGYTSRPQNIDRSILMQLVAHSLQLGFAQQRAIATFALVFQAVNPVTPIPRALPQHRPPRMAGYLADVLDGVTAAV